MSSYLFNQTVTLLARGAETGRDSSNDPVYGSPQETPAPGWVEAGFGPENPDRADTVTKEFTLWLDGQVDLTAYDGVRFNGLTFRIAGDVSCQPGGTFIDGWTNARLERVTG